MDELGDPNQASISKSRGGESATANTPRHPKRELSPSPNLGGGVSGPRHTGPMVAHIVWGRGGRGCRPAGGRWVAGGGGLSATGGGRGPPAGLVEGRAAAPHCQPGPEPRRGCWGPCPHPGGPSGWLTREAYVFSMYFRVFHRMCHVKSCKSHKGK